MINHNHMILLGKAFISNPPRNDAIANEWLTSLVEKIGMNILMGPYSVDCMTLGNEGVTGVVVIETSHASFHCWHAVERPYLMFDVYSCVDFEASTVLSHLDDFFQVDEANFMLIDRNGVPKVVSEGIYKDGRIV